MADRFDLQALLEEILGSKNVYFNPPPNVKMNYPAIRYSRSRIDNAFADNSVYKQDLRYEVTAIYKDPDSDLPFKISRLPKCKHDRPYISDNLHHDVFTLYF